MHKLFFKVFINSDIIVSTTLLNNYSRIILQSCKSNLTFCKLGQRVVPKKAIVIPK